MAQHQTRSDGADLGAQAPSDGQDAKIQDPQPERLAVRCDALLSVDVAERALDQARSRCAHLPHVRFQYLRVPETYPDARFDLTVVSEVGYYWSLDDLARARDLIVEHLAPGGHLMLVHFTNEVAEYPISGDTVHEAFFARAGGAADDALRHVRGRRERRGDFGFRLDLFERRSYRTASLGQR